MLTPYYRGWLGDMFFELYIQSEVPHWVTVLALHIHSSPFKNPPPVCMYLKNFLNLTAIQTQACLAALGLITLCALWLSHVAPWEPLGCKSARYKSRKLFILWFNPCLFYRLFPHPGGNSASIEIYPGDGSVIKSCHMPGDVACEVFFNHYTVGPDGNKERMYSTSNLPPERHGCLYSLASVLARATR